MFQKFKSALDAIAEDQARQRIPTPSSRTSASGRRSHSRGDPSAGRSATRTGGGGDKAIDLSGPDIDPTLFEGEFVVGEDDTQSRNATPKPRTTSAEDGDGAQSAPAGPQKTREAPVSSTERDDNTEYSVEVENKLKKLNKLEHKYQELLRAYRKAHARNSAIEPFEARLREITPLTSIADPDAFVEYLQQINLRAEMAMGELKKVSEEKEGLKQRLKESEDKHESNARESAEIRGSPRNTVDAQFDEAAKCRVAVSQSTERNPESQGAFKEPHSTVASPKSISSTFPAAPKNHDHDNDSGEPEEFFSVESEVPRLEAEIKKRDREVFKLEEQKNALEAELAVAKESAQHMMQNMETAQSDLESLQAMYEQEQRKLQEEVRSLQESTEKSNSTQEKKPNANLIVSPQAGDAESSSNGNLSLPLDAELTVDSTVAGETLPTSTNTAEDSQILQHRLNESQKELEGSQKMAEKLNAKLKDQEDLVEEIEQLRDELVNLGQEHVTAKDQVQSLSVENASLKQRAEELKQEFGLLQTQSTSSDTTSEKTSPMAHEKNAQTGHQDGSGQGIEVKKSVLDGSDDHVEHASTVSPGLTSNEVQQLRLKLNSVEKDLSAAQQLAASRFKEIASLKDLIQRAQPELASLRTEVADLRATKEEMQAKVFESRRLESRLENTRLEAESLRKKIAAKDADINGLNQKLTQENSRRLTLEESQRKIQREVQRLQNEKTEINAGRELAERLRGELEHELNTARPKLRQLQDQSKELNGEIERLKEEVGLRTAQHDSAQSLMTSARDQASEMAIQVKESKERCDSLEEELADAHRLMNERGREGETMRRLLAEVEGRANARVKDMREKMEHAIQERDRTEEEAGTSARRKARDLDDLKTKLRNVERDLKLAIEDKTDMENTEKELRRQRDEEQRRIEQMTQEVADTRKSMGELRDALDDGERQAKELELEKTEAKKALEEVQARLEKSQATNKTILDELKVVRAAKAKQTEAPSSRSSETSLTSRDPSQNKRQQDPSSKSQAQAIDFVYLKTVLLQFLEQKDKALQRQLVPVLGMLLKFDRGEEHKWITAVNSR